MNNQDIECYNSAIRRLRNNNYGWLGCNHSRDGDELIKFTTEITARDQSANTFRDLMSLGKKHNASYFIINDGKIQYLSTQTHRALAREIETSSWFETPPEEHWRQPLTTIDVTDQGTCHTVKRYDHNLVIPEYFGVYDLNSNIRIKNRRQIIEIFWEHGFATWRGRPPTVANLRWSGSRTELEELTELYYRYWDRRNVSDMAKKMVSAFRGINRYAAWPGAW